MDKHFITDGTDYCALVSDCNSLCKLLRYPSHIFESNERDLPACIATFLLCVQKPLIFTHQRSEYGTERSANFG